MVEADLERAEERAELGEKYVFIRIIVDCCVVLIVVDLEISLKIVWNPSQINAIQIVWKIC